MILLYFGLNLHLGFYFSCFYLYSHAFCKCGYIWSLLSWSIV